MAEAPNTESVTARLAAIDENLNLLTDYLDPEGLEAEVAKCEEIMQQPGFWDDQDKAASVSADHARAQRKLEGFRSLRSEAVDLAEMAEMAEGDEEIAGADLSRVVADAADRRALRGGDLRRDRRS